MGISGGKIATVTQESIGGDEAIDATGHVVCPGFIDMHHHNAGYPFGQKLALRDGVTTPMELEMGVYPVKTWYDALAGASRTNYGASVGSIPIRERLLNPDYEEVEHGYFLLDMLVDPDAVDEAMALIEVEWEDFETEEEVDNIVEVVDTDQYAKLMAESEVVFSF